MSPYVIYLDQSRVSEMVRVVLGEPGAGGAHRRAYELLHPRLLELVRSGTAVCPFSLWHAVESVLFDRDDHVRVAVCSFFDAAAGGTSFRFFQSVFEDELAALGGAPTRQPLGAPLDCFPDGAITQLTRDLLGGGPGVFSTVVELLRENEGLLARFVDYRERMLAALRGYLEKYNGTLEFPVSPPSIDTIRSDLGRDVVAHHLRGLVARGLPMATAEQIRSLAATGIDDETWVSIGVPGIGAWSEVFASRVHRGGKADSTKKRRGEAFDLCHMAALAYSDVFLMERKFTAIGERAARVSGTRLVDAPADLLADLESFGERGSSG